MRYSDAARAPPSASRFPRLAPVPDRSPMKRPPAVTTATAPHSSGLVRSRNRTRSNTATNSGLIVTKTSEDSTEVIDSDVTHRAKCTASSAPASIVTGDRRSCCNSVTLRDTTTPRLEQKGSGGSVSVTVLHFGTGPLPASVLYPVSYTHLRAHETRHDLVCRLLLEKKKKIKTRNNNTQK